MKAIILLLCLFICYKSNAQDCEFDKGVGSLNPKDAFDYGTSINADNVKLIEDSNFFYILSVANTFVPTNVISLRIRKYDKCGNILLDERQQKISDLRHYKIMITQGISSNWNICLKGDSITIFEMDTNCNLRKLFFIKENTLVVNDFARVDSNQFVFVGHKNDKAIVFATDTLGNKIWQKIDTFVTSGNNYYNKIKKDITNQIYLLGSQNNRFTKTIMNSDGLISKTIYYETGITQKLNRLNYELTFSNNMQFFYAFVLMSGNQLISKYDSVNQIAYKVLMSKADSIINMKATSNGFSVITNGENYLIDSTLTPYFNQPYFYGYSTGVSRSYLYHRNYNTDLLLSNDSFIVSVNSRYMSGLGANILNIKFYKEKISTSLQQPIMVDSGTILHSKYPSIEEPYLNIKLLNSNAITVSWWCNKKTLLIKNIKLQVFKILTFMVVICNTVP